MIVVFGSANLDLIWRAERLPKPGETVLGAAFAQAEGGKGLNQAIAAQRARGGASEPVRFFGAIGDDGFGTALRGMLDRAGVDSRGLATISEPTGAAGIMVDRRGENAIIVASGANHAARAAQVPDEALGPQTVVVLQMETRTDETAAVIFRASNLGARIVLNLAPALPLDEAVLRRVNALVVNEVEGAMLASSLGLAVDSPLDLCRALTHRLSARVVMSLGPEGAIAAAGPLAWRIGTLNITPVDTTGAGDAFVGALAVALDEGRVLPDALRFASVAGGLACLKPGAAPSMPTRAEIEARLSALAPAESL